MFAQMNLIKAFSNDFGSLCVLGFLEEKRIIMLEDQA